MSPSRLRALRWLLVAAASGSSACERDPRIVPPPPMPPIAPASTDTGRASVDAGGPARPETTPRGAGPGFPVAGPWVSFYGTAAQMGDLARVAARYRIINIDADPGAANFTDAQIEQLKGGGKNRVLSYMNVGACEIYRPYWSKAPAGFMGCGPNRAAHLGKYDGYPDETWMDPSNADYQKLVVEHVAARLAARGVDGFYLDNLELLGHGTATKNGPCSARCKQGGLDLVRRLREKFPDRLIVMQNGTSDVTRLGTTGGIAFPTLLDGIAHEEVYAPKVDAEAEAELLAWKGMGLETRAGHPFWIAVEDYVGSCKASAEGRAALARASAKGFSSYVSDESGGQKVVCWW